jgi:hypothetical protein
MNDYHSWNSIQSVTPTICALMGIDPPEISTADPLTDVVRAAQEVLRGRPVQKCLVYAPDALGNHLSRRFPDLFQSVAGAAPVETAVQSVLPPKTPVCFASMFTGAAPERHGIRQYERPVLRCDTLFDALIRAGRRAAIAAVKNCSIDLIFRERKIDYHSETYDPEVTERVEALLEADRHDFLLAYHQEYDDSMHATEPFSEQAVRAAGNHAAAFLRIAKAFDERWSRHDRMIIFAPDHGAHRNPADGRGTHGEDIPEDMELRHFYGFRPGVRP